MASSGRKCDSAGHGMISESLRPSGLTPWVMAAKISRVVHLPRPVCLSGVRLPPTQTPEAGSPKPTSEPPSRRLASGWPRRPPGVWQSLQPAMVTRYWPRSTGVSAPAAPMQARLAARAMIARMGPSVKARLVPRDAGAAQPPLLRRLFHRPRRLGEPLLQRGPQRPHFAGRSTVRVEFGDAPAAPRRLLIIDARQHQRRQQAAHRLQRRHALLDAGVLLRRRALVEQEHV